MVFLDGSFLDSLEDFIVVILNNQKILSPILLLVVEESGIPLPVPGDLIIAYTGYQVSKGVIPYFTAFILLLISVLLGSSILYFLSLRFGDKLVRKVGKYMHLNEEKLTTVEKYFNKYGPLVIIFGRHIPGFRIPITIFSGISRVSYKTFIFSTFISVIFWIIIYLQIGARLGKKTLSLFHAHFYNSFFVVIPLILLVALYFYLKAQKKLPKKLSI